MADLVNGTLKDFLDQRTHELLALDPALEPLADACLDLVLAGGKRLRPTFGYWGWRAAVGPEQPCDPVLPALAALELLHAFALAHDDVMDDSDSRRGRPTAHRAMAALHRARQWKGDPEHFGRSAAILVGDLCLVWADQLIDQCPIPPQVLQAARAGYDQMRVETVAGQFLDVVGEASLKWTADQALRTAELKTASYTVTRPLLFGATLGRLSEPDARQALTGYGSNIGVAFQLRDDLLGLYGDPAVTGKPVGEDLRIGKPTVLLELARSLATPAQGAELDRLLTRPTSDTLDRITYLIGATGATARLDQMIKQRVSAALDALNRAVIHPCARQPLEQLAVAAAWRDA